MDWASIERNWDAYQANARARWGRLSRMDLERIAGSREQLLAKLRERYGLDEAQALQQLAGWQTGLRRPNPFG
jgi:uncharacterized protein YjbJ (UPF0337 family)